MGGHMRRCVWMGGDRRVRVCVYGWEMTWGVCVWVTGHSDRAHDGWRMRGGLSPLLPPPLLSPPLLSPPLLAPLPALLSPCASLPLPRSSRCS
eukprot:239947-Rhodomonas_salina.1